MNRKCLNQGGMFHDISPFFIFFCSRNVLTYNAL